MKTNLVNRRHFIKLSATAGAALALNATGARGAEAPSSKMPERTLGQTGITVPILSMGVMRADNPAIVRAAYNSGIRLFDTANGYQNGKNEEMLGTFFAGKPRESFVLATKVKERQGDHAAENFLKKFEESMKRLKMSYVDILYLHAVSDAADVSYAPILDIMLKLKKDGRVKHLGISTHSGEPAVINAMVDNGNYDVVLTSYNFTQQHIAELDLAIERAVKAGMGVVAMKTMAGGYLDKTHTQKVNAKAALKWAMQHTNIHTAIPGFTSFDELDECLAAVADLTLTQEEKDFLAQNGTAAGMYCQGCRKCVADCPRHLPIPDLMRAYMYQYGYRSSQTAKDTLMELALDEHPCRGCAECSVRCSAGFSVAPKIGDIMRLQTVPDEFLAYV